MAPTNAQADDAQAQTFRLSVNIPRWLIKAIRNEKADTDLTIQEIALDQLSKRYPRKETEATRGTRTR